MLTPHEMPTSDQTPSFFDGRERDKAKAFVIPERFDGRGQNERSHCQALSPTFIFNKRPVTTQTANTQTSSIIVVRTNNETVCHKDVVGRLLRRVTTGRYVGDVPCFCLRDTDRNVPDKDSIG